MTVKLVTGANGWLGSSLMNALPKDTEIRGGDVTNSNTTSKVDIRNPEHCNVFCQNSKGGVLFHTAGIIHPQKVKDFYAINVEGTRNILEAAVAAGIKRAVIVSSNSPCGCNTKTGDLFDECSPYNPYMHYGKSKMLMEQLVNDYYKKGKIETVIVRAPWFYGPHQPPRQNLFFEMIRDGKVPIIGSGKNLRSMAYIDNLCEGLFLCSESLIASGQTYWIADKNPYSMSEIVDTIEKLLENEFSVSCAHKRFQIPKFLCDTAWLFDKFLQSLGQYHQKVHVLSEMDKNIACSIEKAESELGYKPKISLEEGMRRSITWCLQQGVQF
jgi:nucleoside-diphosphate-sugar epimerase